jgi:ABC-type sugar transport system permease subunit
MTNDVKVRAVNPKKTKIASLDRRKARAGWIFVLPFILGFLLIYIPMIYDSILLSFQSVNYATNTRTFIGWANYDYVLGEYVGQGGTFLQVLVSGLKSLAFDLPAILIFALFMAVMLNQKAAGRGFFRAIFFLPVITATGIMDSIASLDTSVEQAEGGIDDGSGNSMVSALDIQSLFSNMAVGGELVQYVVDIINNIYGVVNRSGVQMLIFLAGLQSISPAIYESCKIDGATAWETFWKITLPMISPMILVNGVYTIIDSFTTSSNPMMSYISDAYKGANAAPGGAGAASSAMAWMYFLVVILIVAVIASILSAFVFYQRKND